MPKQEQSMALDVQDKMAMLMVLAAPSLVWQVTHQMGYESHRRLVMLEKWEAPRQSHEKYTKPVLAGVIETTKSPGTSF